MQDSHIIEISGRFAGAAVRHIGRPGYVFKAVHPGARMLDGRMWPTLDAARHAVQAAMRASPSLPIVVEPPHGA